MRAIFLSLKTALDDFTRISSDIKCGIIDQTNKWSCNVHTLIWIRKYFKIVNHYRKFAQKYRYWYFDSRLILYLYPGFAFSRQISYRTVHGLFLVEPISQDFRILAQINSMGLQQVIKYLFTINISENIEIWSKW